MDMNRFRIFPPDVPNGGILFADLEKLGRSGHMGHALVEYAPGKVLAFYPTCSAEDRRWKGHSGFGWMEYKRSLDGGETWSDPITEPHSKALFDADRGRTFMCEKAVVTPSGRIILFYLQCDMRVNGHIWEPYFEPHYAFSEDGGATWSDLRMFEHEGGRIYDAICKDGVVYVMFYADAELPGTAHQRESQMRLYVSHDDGETFEIRSVMGFQSTNNCYYGTMCFTPEDDLIVYTYDEKDEHNLKYIVSRDLGKTWEPNRRAFFAQRMRNPQLACFHGTYFMHGRSGSFGNNPGHFILYTSPDGFNWDEGQMLALRTAGVGAYSNNILVHTPDGRERLLIQTSHAYFENNTNTIMFFVEDNA